MIEHPTHYYGDYVRQLFLIAGAVMIVTLPFFNDLVAWPVQVSIIAIVALVLLAGLTNPVQVWTNILDLVTATIGVIVFEYEAVLAFTQVVSTKGWWWFASNQLIALCFFLALYLSGKTVRARMIK